LLEARVKGEKEVHIEEFCDVQGFLGKFIEENFPFFKDIGSKALLEAFKKRYGEPTI